MNYFSTRNKELRRSPSEAVVEGIAPDGGLYLPEAFVPFDMSRLAQMDDETLAATILGGIFDDFSEEELRSYIHAAYSTAFENGDIAPLKEVGDRYILELWHGPTCAFKDVALCLLPHLLTAASRKCGVNDDICILTATSGDTGSAALSGFSDVPGTRIAVFFPDGGVSPMQKRQMVSCPGKNTTVCAVRGNFDDAQTGVKNIFTGMKAPAGVRFSSANSINIGRLAPQIVYYFKAYRDLLKAGKIALGGLVDFVVPTGNFGDILAGYFAKQMGLPVGKLVCASNKNNVLTDFLETGCYDRRRDFHLTASPSMDILISSNLERLIALKGGTELTAALMKQLKEDGVYTIPAGMKEDLQKEFAGFWTSEEGTFEAIRQVFEKEHYLMDTHTAVAYAASRAYAAEEGRPVVVLSTASPYKFSANVLKALGQEPTGDEFADLEKLRDYSSAAVPAPLAALKNSTELHKNVRDIAEMPEFVREFASR